MRGSGWKQKNRMQEGKRRWSWRDEKTHSQKKRWRTNDPISALIIML